MLIIVEQGISDVDADLTAFLAFQLGIELAAVMATEGQGPRGRELQQLLADVAAGERHAPALTAGEEWKGPGRMQVWMRDVAARILRAPSHVKRAEQNGG